MSSFDHNYELLNDVLKANGISQSPVIVLGMHRSGTSMLAKLLSKSGLFMGSRLSGNHEPRLIQDVNRQIFDYFDASWLSADKIPPSDAFRTGFTALATEVALRLSEDLMLSFFGSHEENTLYWGFKDPRTSLTAGLFLRLFPDAKALFIHRDGLDVAASILQREIKRREKYPQAMREPLTAKDSEVFLLRSVKAWELYNKRVLEILPFFNTRQVLRYEDVVRSPPSILRGAFDHLGLTFDEDVVREAGLSTRRIGAAAGLDVDLSLTTDYLKKSPIHQQLQAEDS